MRHILLDHPTVGERHAELVGVEIDADELDRCYHLRRRASHQTVHDWISGICTDTILGSSLSDTPVRILGTLRNPHATSCLSREAQADRKWGTGVNPRHAVLAGVLLGDPQCDCVEALLGIPDPASLVQLIRSQQQVLEAWWGFFRNHTQSPSMALRWISAWQQAHPALTPVPWDHWGPELARVLCAAHSSTEESLRIMGRVQPVTLEEGAPVLVHARPTHAEAIALVLQSEPAHQRLGIYHYLPERQARRAFGENSVAHVPLGLDTGLVQLALELYEAELGNLETPANLQRAVDTAVQSGQLVT